MEERLKKFVTLVNAGTFTAAARLLHTSQPALTTAIQKLEMELKTPLLNHGSRRLRLTDAGQAAYQQGQQLIIASKNFKAKLNTLNNHKNKLGMGSIDSIAATLVEAGALSILEEDCKLLLNVQDSTSLVRGLVKSNLDIAIIVHQLQLPTGIVAHPLGSERFTLVCHKSLASKYKTEVKQGILTDFLAYARPSTTYGILEDQLMANGLRYKTRFHSSNPSILMQLALQGNGIAALPTTMIKSDLNQLAEISLKTGLNRPIDAVWQTGRILPQSVEICLSMLESKLVKI